MKAFMLWLHRWFGLIVGFYFVLLGLTGSYLVYEDFFESVLQKDLRTSAAASESYSLSAIVESSQKGIGTDRFPQQVILPENPQSSAIAVYTFMEGKERKRIQAFVDAGTNEFKGQVNFAQSLTGWMFRFHHDLFLGGLGKTIVAVAGIMMLALLLTGLYLWWPIKGNFRKALTLRSLRNAFLVNYELHRLGGFYTLILMIMVTFTGIVIARPDWFSNSGRRGRPPFMEGGDQVVFDLKFIGDEIAGQGLPSRPLNINFDTRKGIAKIKAGSAGQEQNFEFDAATPEFKKIEAAEPPKKSFRNINFALHVGDFWGAFGKFLMFLSGLLPLVFYISGFYIWMKKPKKKIAKT